MGIIKIRTGVNVTGVIKNSSYVIKIIKGHTVFCCRYSLLKYGGIWIYDNNRGISHGLNGYSG